MAGLIVEGAFTSMLDMAKLSGSLSFFPLAWILTQRFESLDKVRSLIPPILLLNGTNDATIPVSMGQALQQAAQGRTQPTATTLILIPDAGHNNLPTIGGDLYTQTLTDFISRVTGSPADPETVSSYP